MTPPQLEMRETSKGVSVSSISGQCLIHKRGPSWAEARG